MYVCVCHAVTERQIRQAAASGAKNLRDLRRDLGVTLDCGRCAVCALHCLRAAQAKARLNDAEVSEAMGFLANGGEQAWT